MVIITLKSLIKISRKNIGIPTQTTAEQKANRIRLVGYDAELSKNMWPLILLSIKRGSNSTLCRNCVVPGNKPMTHLVGAYENV